MSAVVEIEDDGYPVTDWPFTFYFNGEALPKWSAAWPISFLTNHWERKEWNDELSDREAYHISTRIDHYGVVESAPPGDFLFAVQSVLLLLLEHKTEAATAIRAFQGSPNPDEVMAGLVEGCLQMRELVQRDKLALWTSGYEADRTKLKALMSQLENQPKQLLQFPHQAQRSRLLQIFLGIQIKQLHRLAQNGTLDKAMRARLHQFSMPDESFLQLVT